MGGGGCATSNTVQGRLLLGLGRQGEARLSGDDLSFPSFFRMTTATAGVFLPDNGRRRKPLVERATRSMLEGRITCAWIVGQPDKVRLSFRLDFFLSVGSSWTRGSPISLGELN